MPHSPASAPRPLRILCLHGFTQSAPLFSAKTRALEKALARAFPPAPKPGSLPSFPGGVALHYMTAPHRLSPAEDPFSSPPSSADGSAAEAYAWWRRRDTGGTPVYDGLEASVAALAAEMRARGPFDGVLGFSQGACAAVVLAALLEPGRRANGLEEKTEGVPPLGFAVSYSGFRVPAGMGWDGIYEGGLSTPTLHFVGSVDTVVSEERSLESLEACRAGKKGAESRHKIVYHPGGHFVPASQKVAVDALVVFIRDAVGGEKEVDGKAQDGEESVEDMDVPF